MAHDVRAVANAVLKLADSMEQGVSNLALNKILYFVHAAFLHEFNEPLISAKIEAWDHGPVFREIYHQFKCFGRDTITAKARRLDPTTGELFEVGVTLHPAELQHVERHARELLRLSPGKLVNMSHVSDGPWYLARYGNGRLNPGVEITDDMIQSAPENQARH